MRSLLFIGIICCSVKMQGQSSQSPYLSVKANVIGGSNVHYAIRMKMCEPVKKSAGGNIFDSAISSIDFAALKPADMKCDDYRKTDDSIGYNNFHFGNHVFAWEKIIILEISNQSSRAWWPEMYVVLPVKMKSFITFIRLKDIFFQSGKMIWLDEAGTSSEQGRQTIELSLINREGVLIKDSPWKEFFN